MPERGFLTLLRVAESTRTKLERKYISWYGGSARTGWVQDSLGFVVRLSKHTENVEWASGRMSKRLVAIKIKTRSRIWSHVIWVSGAVHIRHVGERHAGSESDSGGRSEVTDGSVAGKAHVVCPLGTPVTSTGLVLLPRALGRGVWVCFVLIEIGYHVAKTDLRLAVGHLLSAGFQVCVTMPVSMLCWGLNPGASRLLFMHCAKRTTSPAPGKQIQYRHIFKNTDRSIDFVKSYILS